MIRQITENFAVGNADDARRHGDDFDRVISLATPPDSSTDEFLLTDGDHDYTTFESAVDTVIEALENNERVLVHCQAGISRSVSVCIAAYVCYGDIEYTDAYEECRHGFQYPASQLTDSAKKYIDEYEPER